MISRKMLFNICSESQSVSSFSVEEKEAVNRLRSEKYIRENGYVIVDVR